MEACTWQVCLFWRPGKSCQVQPDETVERVCVRQSPNVMWGASGGPVAAGETCGSRASGWAPHQPVCDTVRCGETAVFAIRDGGSCSAGSAGSRKVRDASGVHNFTCSPTSGNSPCASCAGGTADTDSCRWTWTAPASASAAAALVAPTQDKCRCTLYKPAPIKEWLCSSLTSCPAQSGRRRFRSLLGSGGGCQPEYPGSRSCWLHNNWDKVMQVQGLGAGVDSLVLGAGDRTVSLNLAALECACAAWGLASKTMPVKALP